MFDLETYDKWTYNEFFMHKAVAYGGLLLGGFAIFKNGSKFIDDASRLV